MKKKHLFAYDDYKQVLKTILQRAIDGKYA